MAEIRVLPGVNRPDLVSDVTDPKAALHSALDAGLLHVVIVGRLTNGEISVWGSQPDADQVIGLLMRGASSLVGARQIQSQDEPGNGESA